ncbi:MAG: epoxyqueuosine reductase QueH [Clostridiales bacterium]|nr:epoxyqueuosine reductase QueH [Clostridiales bacterium]
MNRTDYNKCMKEVAAGAKGATLLLHVCCAPCSSSVLPRLSDFAVTPFYFNPNIDTKEEFEKRYVQFEKLGVKPVCVPYDHAAFLQVVQGTEKEKEGGARCHKCIYLRLEETAKYAAANGFAYFCSSLSVSPHKDAAFINEAGEMLAKQYGVSFLPNDFKKENGFFESVRLSKSADLYRQSYCGCEFAKRETEAEVL